MKAVGMILALLVIFLGCSEPSNVRNENVDVVYQKRIEALLLKGHHSSHSYEPLMWKKLHSSEVVSKRIGKRALFIQHRFREKNIYKGSLEKESVYFIGDGAPSLMFDFDVKKAFDAFISNPTIQKLFASSIWNLESLHVNYQQSASNKASKEVVKDFIYSIRHYSKEDLSYLEEEISKAYMPLSIANTMALFMSMRLFPELLEELLFDEVIYTGTYK